MTDARRTYYDHESAYRRIKAKGGRGWDDLFDTVQHSYVELRAFLAGERPAPGTTALEVGCGGGQASLELARAGFDTTGIDFSETAIELATANAAGLPIRFVAGDVLALPFPDASFALVVDNHLLHCIIEPADRARALAEIRRVLVPGGRLWSDTMSCGAPFDVELAKADPVTRIALNRTRIWVSRAELERELVDAGFTIDHMREVPGDFCAMVVTLARS